jgi:hypothetical protein
MQVRPLTYFKPAETSSFDGFSRFVRPRNPIHDGRVCDSVLAAWLRSSTHWLTAIVARRLAIDEHMANLLPEPGANPRSFLADEHIVALGVADYQSIIFEATEAQ